MGDDLMAYYSSDGQSDGVVLTPQWFLDQIVEEFGEYHDPCPFNPTVDGLESEWDLNKINYVNPPYKRGQIALWVMKAAIEHAKGCKIAMLIPVYSDTIYFHEYIYKKPNIEIRLLRGRIKFVNSKTQEPFKSQLPSPMMLVVFS